jgi:hypothetical protein
MVNKTVPSYPVIQLHNPTMATNHNSNSSSSNAADPHPNSTILDNESTYTPQRFIDVKKLQQEWSPEYVLVARSRSGGLKIRSLNNNSRPLRGGDFFDEAATVAFCFKKDNKKYGVTIAHLADQCHEETNAVLRPGQVGDKLFAFLSDEPNAAGEHDIVEIGTIVVIEGSTDSMVFEVNDRFHVDPLVLHPYSGMQTRISYPRLSWDPLGRRL